MINLHPERTLQQPKDCSKGCSKSSKVLEVVEDKASRLFVVIHSKNDNHHNDER